MKNKFQTCTTRALLIFAALINAILKNPVFVKPNVFEGNVDADTVYSQVNNDTVKNWLISKDTRHDDKTGFKFELKRLVEVGIIYQPEKGKVVYHVNRRVLEKARDLILETLVEKDIVFEGLNADGTLEDWFNVSCEDSDEPCFLSKEDWKEAIGAYKAHHEDIYDLLA